MARFSWVDSYFKAYSCIVIATWHLFSTTKLFSNLKCSCSPFAFSIWEILLHSSCRHMYRTLYFRPFTLMLFKMPHKSKGSSSCFVLSTGYRNYCMKGLSYYELILLIQLIQVRAHIERKTPEDPANTPHKEVAFLQQHSQLKKGGRAPSLLLAF